MSGNAVIADGSRAHTLDLTVMRVAKTKEDLCLSSIAVYHHVPAPGVVIIMAICSKGNARDICVMSL